MDTINAINYVITQLDQLSVQGARNMGIVLQCINQLAQVKHDLEGGNVQNKAE